MTDRSYTNVMARPRRSQNTRSKLLDEGLRALLARGYNGTGIKEVLDVVQVPKGSFYNYFKSKEDFGAEVLRHYADKFCGRMQPLFAAAGGALAALRSFFDQEIALYEERPTGCLVGNLAAELGGSLEQPRKVMSEAMQGTRDAFAGILARAQEQGTVRADIGATELADFLFNAWEGSLLRMKVEGSVEPVRQCVSFALDDFFRPRQE